MNYEKITFSDIKERDQFLRHISLKEKYVKNRDIITLAPNGDLSYKQLEYKSKEGAE